MKRIWIGRHRIIISREPMLGVGIEVSAWPYTKNEGGQGRLWTLRVVFLAWTLTVSFSEGNIE